MIAKLDGISFEYSTFFTTDRVNCVSFCKSSLV